MKNIKLICLLFFIMTLLSACGPKYTTKKDAFPKMYDDRPLSILVLPPINMTTAADAKEYYSTTIAEPLSYAGYYIYPIEVTSEILKAEGLYDTELIVNLPPQKFKQYFDADAVLYIKILKWDTSYYVIGGSVTVSVDFLLKSTTTGEDLWKDNRTIKAKTGGPSGAGIALGPAGVFVDAIVTTAIRTATAADDVPIAKLANRATIFSMPYGKYHPNFDKDREDKIVVKKKTEEQ